jgi:dihydropteroate synthase
MVHKLSIPGRSIDLTRPQVMGVLNITPDSFHPGSRVERATVVEKARLMVASGATFLDIGGASSRPGASVVSVEEEKRRVLPVLSDLRDAFDVVLSVDTYQPEVMAASVEAGCDMINDILALRMPGALDIIKQSDVAVCLMHMKGMPDTMQQQAQYDDVVQEVYDFLAHARDRLVHAGVSSDRIVLDPGFGFAKTCDHNIKLLKHLSRFSELNQPILAGLSRKRMFEHLFNLPVEDRLTISVVAHTLAAQQGASILRVHDVAETAQAMRLLDLCAA